MMQKKQATKRYVTLTIIVLLLVASVATVVLAAYIKKTADVKNTFTPAVSVTPEVDESFDNHKEKKDVSIYVGDTGYPVYVRAQIIITWKDENGIVFFSEPKLEEGEYFIDLNLAADGWVKGADGYYYYTKKVESGENTGILINSARQLKTPYDGYMLSIEIIAQTVQAVGTTDEDEKDAWKDAWGDQNPLPTSTPAPTEMPSPDPTDAP